MKLYVCGPARHGKDTVAGILRHVYGLTHESSSHFCMRHFLRQELEDQYGLKYETDEECFADRLNHRNEWFDLITAYNLRNGDRARLSRELFAEYDIYVGIRNRDEFLAARREGLVSLAVWVDALDRIPEGRNIHPGEVLPEDCDFIIPNNTTENDLYERVTRTFDLIILNRLPV